MRNQDTENGKKRYGNADGNVIAIAIGIAAGIVIVLLLCVGGYFMLRGDRESKQDEPETKGDGKESSVVWKGVRDFYVASGSTVDYLAGVSAVSLEGEDLSGSIAVDASQVFLDVCGDYELMYSVQAGQGETEAVSCMVFVRDSDHLQQLIDSHVISVQSAYIAGADNTYDSGVFTGESMEAVLEQTKPAFVSLSCTVGDRQLWGSGFILSVDEETVDIVTNAHVVSALDGVETTDAGEQTSCQVRFFTGDEVQAVVCRVQESPDMALLQVAVKSLPAGLLEQLRTVHVEKDGDKEEGTQIGCCYFDRSTGQWEKAFGELMGTEEALWAVDYPVVRYTLSNVPGSSGSAVLDSHGNLTAMVLGNDIGEEDTAYYGIRVEDILLFYAEAKASSDSPEQ